MYPVRNRKNTMIEACGMA